jgi:MipA family protein
MDQLPAGLHRLWLIGRRFKGRRVVTLTFALGVGLVLGELVQAETSQAPTESRPLWQFGFGAGGGVSPHYPASDQSSLRFLATPTFRYRGRVLRADDEGTRARLMKFENAEVDLSGAASFPVGSSENEARRGMRQLDWIGEAGPRLNLRWKFQNAGKLRGDHLRLTIPIRAVASSDGSNLAHRGFIFQPGLSFERVLNAPSSLHSEISVEVDGYINLIDRTLANYYFGVAEMDKTSFRRSFEAAPGLMAASAGLTLFISPKNSPNNGSAFFIGVRNSTMTWSANRDSPLHKADQQFLFFAGFNLLLWNSGAREEDPQSSPAIAPSQPQPMRE